MGMLEQVFGGGMPFLTPTSIKYLNKMINFMKKSSNCSYFCKGFVKSLFLQVLKVQLRPYNLDIENLNQYMNELRNSSPYMAEALAIHVAEINQRWNNLLKEFENREVSFVVLT